MRPQERVRRFAGRHRIVGKAVAEIRHRVLNAIRQRRRGRERRRVIREERRHLGRRLQVPFRVRRQQPPRPFDRRLVADAREHIEERPLDGFGEADAVGRDERHMEGRREIAQHAVGGLLLAQEMPLQFQAHVRAPEHAHQAVHQAAHAVPAGHQRLAADDRDETAREAVQFLEAQRALSFRRAQFHAREQAAEVLVALRGSRRARANAMSGTRGSGFGARGSPFDSPLPRLAQGAPFRRRARRSSAFCLLSSYWLLNTDYWLPTPSSVRTR